MCHPGEQPQGLWGQPCLCAEEDARTGQNRPPPPPWWLGPPLLPPDQDDGGHKQNHRIAGLERPIPRAGLRARRPELGPNHCSSFPRGPSVSRSQTKRNTPESPLGAAKVTHATGKSKSPAEPSGGSPSPRWWPGGAGGEPQCPDPRRRLPGSQTPHRDRQAPRSWALAPCRSHQLTQ